MPRGRVVISLRIIARMHLGQETRHSILDVPRKKLANAWVHRGHSLEGTYLLVWSGCTSALVLPAALPLCTEV